MGTYVVKLENYNKSTDTILGVARSEYLLDIRTRFNHLLYSDKVERAYSNLPDDVVEWFDKDGAVKLKLRQGVDYEQFIKEVDNLNLMLLEVSNEDGIVIFLYDYDKWENASLFSPEEERFQDYRRIK